MVFCLFIGTCLTLLIKENLKRQQAENEENNLLKTADHYKPIQN